MKKVILSTAAFISLAATEHASACSPQLPIFAQQTSLERVTSSEAYNEAISQVMADDNWVRIESITFGGGVTYNFSNGCTVKFKEKFDAPTHPGMCPRFAGVDSEITCN